MFTDEQVYPELDGVLNDGPDDGAERDQDRCLNPVTTGGKSDDD
jgi:hypothetical protein